MWMGSGNGNGNGTWHMDVNISGNLDALPRQTGFSRFPAFPASPDQLREQSVVIGKCVGLWGERCAVIQLRAIKIGAHPHPKNTAQIFNPA